MAKMINKHKLKGTETRADILYKIGGAGGGAKSNLTKSGRGAIYGKKKSRRGKFGVNKMTKEESKQRAKETKQERIQRKEEKHRESKKDSRQKEMDKLYGDWLPKGERPMTVKSTPSAAQIKKASKDYY